MSKKERIEKKKQTERKFESVKPPVVSNIESVCKRGSKTPAKEMFTFYAKVALNFLFFLFS